MIKSLIVSGILVFAATDTARAGCVQDQTLASYRHFADEAETLKPKIIDKRGYQSSLDNLRALIQKLESLNLSPVKCKLLAGRVLVTEDDLRKMAKNSGVELD